MNQAFQRRYDKRFHYLTRQQLKDLAKLLSTIRTRGGLTLVTGPAGTGKTTLLKRIVEECRAENVFVIHILAPSPSFDFLIEALFEQVGPGMNVPTGQMLCLEALQDALYRLQSRHRVLICIDEAQTAPDDVLLGLFEVAGFDSASGTVRVPLLLTGTDDIAQRLTRLLGRPLEQFVGMTFPLVALSQDEVVAYMQHQLAAAEIKDKDIFCANAIEQITALSGGVPSEISSLCGLAMYAAHLDGSKRVTSDILNRVTRDYWITPMKRAAEDSVPAAQVAGEVMPPRDHGGTAITGDMDFRKAEKTEAARHTKIAGKPYAPAGDRPHSRKTWGWMALAVTLFIGALSNILRHELPSDFSWNFAWLEGYVKDEAADLWPTDPNQEHTGSEPNSWGPNLAPSVLGPASTKDRSADRSGAPYLTSTVQAQSEQPSTKSEALESIQGTQNLDDRSKATETVARSLHDTLASNESVRTMDPGLVLSPTAAGGRGGAHQALENFHATPLHVPVNDQVPLIDPETLHKQGFGLAPPQTSLRPRLIGQLRGQATVRTRPSTQAPSLVTLRQGDRVTITARVAKSNWYQVVEQSGELGYIYAELVNAERTRSRFSTGISEHELQLIPLDEGEALLLEVPRLLQLAMKHREADRLLAPRFDNAFSVYREVLRIDPGNADAQQGIREIKTKLIGHAQNAKARGDLVAAKHALIKVLRIDAADQQALHLINQVQEAEN